MIAVGVDTHKQRHHAVALDPLGQLRGELSFAASAAGYAELQRWAEGLREEQPLVFGIEGAGSWGAGLCEHLQGAGHSVVERASDFLCKRVTFPVTVNCTGW
jgi:transposase